MKNKDIVETFKIPKNKVKKDDLYFLDNCVGVLEVDKDGRVYAAIGTHWDEGKNEAFYICHHYLRKTKPPKKAEAEYKTEQRKILEEFIKKHLDLKNDDVLKRVKDKLRKIVPADPLDPNLSLKKDLEQAYSEAIK